VQKLNPDARQHCLPLIIADFPVNAKTAGTGRVDLVFLTGVAQFQRRIARPGRRALVFDRSKEWGVCQSQRWKL
jgi:hypothetical protein